MLLRMATVLLGIVVQGASHANLANAPPPQKHVRPPATPLIVCNPYFSVWSFGDKLNAQWPSFWSGAKETGMSSMMRVDGGEAVALMGLLPGVLPALQLGIPVVAATKTTYTFSDSVALQPLGPQHDDARRSAKVQVQLSFVSPARADDLNTTKPLAYITWDAVSTDGKEHDVALYFDISSDFAVSSGSEAVVWGRTNSTVVLSTGAGSKADPSTNSNHSNSPPKSRHSITWSAMRIGTEAQTPFTVAGHSNRINWGHIYSAVSSSSKAKTRLSGASGMRAMWSKNGTLPAEDDTRMPRPVNDDEIVAATTFACNTGRSSSSSSSKNGGSSSCTRGLVVAYDDVFSVQYDHNPLQAWWRQDLPNETAAETLLASAFTNQAAELEACANFDAKLQATLESVGGQHYAEIGALTYRQTLGANVLVALPNGAGPAHLSRECGSGDDILTADVVIDSLPFFLFFSTAWVKAELQPLLSLAANELVHAKWPFKYAPHDMGKYPIANAYDGRAEETMPLEESGNLLVMLAAVAQRDGTTAWIKEAYWPIIQSWANYCAIYGLYPEKQLSSDDFDGPIANRSNLALKAIVGVGAFAELARIRGDTDAAVKYRKTAEGMVLPWLAAARNGDHIALQYGGTGTHAWGMQYSLWLDDLLRLQLFSGAYSNGVDIRALQKTFYATKVGRYGLQLDGRHRFTIQPWATWVYSSKEYSQTEFEVAFEKTWKFVDESLSRWPLTDWYNTDDGLRVGFEARSMWGGIYSRIFTGKENANVSFS